MFTENTVCLIYKPRLGPTNQVTKYLTTLTIYYINVFGNEFRIGKNTIL